MNIDVSSLSLELNMPKLIIQDEQKTKERPNIIILKDKEKHDSYDLF